MKKLARAAIALILPPEEVWATSSPGFIALKAKITSPRGVKPVIAISTANPRVLLITARRYRAKTIRAQIRKGELPAEGMNVVALNGTYGTRAKLFELAMERLSDPKFAVTRTAEPAAPEQTPPEAAPVNDPVAVVTISSSDTSVPPVSPQENPIEAPVLEPESASFAGQPTLSTR